MIGRARDDLAVAVTIQAFEEAPSVTKPLRSTNQASRAPCSRAACLASTLGSSDTDLMSTRAQRDVRHGDDRDALAAPTFALALAIERLRAVTTIAGRRFGRRKRDGRAARRRA